MRMFSKQKYVPEKPITVKQWNIAYSIRCTLGLFKVDLDQMTCAEAYEFIHKNMKAYREIRASQNSAKRQFRKANRGKRFYDEDRMYMDNESFYF